MRTGLLVVLYSTRNQVESCLGSTQVLWKTKRSSTGKSWVHLP